MKRKIAQGIVRARYILLALMLALAVFSAMSIRRTRINYDLTRYLSENTMTRKSLEKMKEEGVILGWEKRQQQNNEALWTSGDSGLVRELSAALQSAGLEGRKAGVRWCCDASIYCPRSAETVIFGPGSIRQGHATEEFIDVDELRRGTEGLGRLWPRRAS